MAFSARVSLVEATTFIDYEVRFDFGCIRVLDTDLGDLLDVLDRLQSTESAHILLFHS
jgi:hypothetical protein